MKKLALVLLLVMGLGVGSAGMVQADNPINLGTWYEFEFGPAGSFAIAGGGVQGVQGAPAPAWTYTGASIVTIVDTALSGDMLTLYDNGGFVGTTSSVSNDITNLFYLDPSLGPDAALTHPELSYGLFTLPGGGHSLTIQTFQNTYGNTSGIAFFRVDANPVPLPPSAWLLGSSLLGLVGWRRFRKA
jgi:hypothetical protein